MKYIELTQGKRAIVDDSDFETLNEFKWTAANVQGRHWYASHTFDGKYKYMHAFIMKTPTGMVTDHINGDGLDNRRENLRICDQSINNFNRIGLNKRNTSGFHGVTLEKGGKKWKVSIQINKKYIYLGTFISPFEASKAYEEYKYDHVKI
jgi:hypothetical protein